MYLRFQLLQVYCTGVLYTHKTSRQVCHTSVKSGRVISKNHFKPAEIRHVQRSSANVARLEEGAQRDAEVRLAPPTSEITWSSCE